MQADTQPNSEPNEANPSMHGCQTESSLPRVLIYGAGDGGLLAIGKLLDDTFEEQHGIPTAVVDDDPSKTGMRLLGVPVVGTGDDLGRIVDEQAIDLIIISIPSATTTEYNEIFNRCTATECAVKTLPRKSNIDCDNPAGISIHEIRITDLLDREEVELDLEMAQSYLGDKVILVTGGGGSIGSELCRQVACSNPERIVIFDIYENNAYLLMLELQREFPDIDVVVEIGNICDKRRLISLFEKHHPQIVFHAAAHKHVPLMEISPNEAISNNIFGTLQVANAAVEYGVERFVFISTDKAVNPTSIMGATKRIGEMVVKHLDERSDTIFAAVRFGNVLGSSGSVIPIFKRQIKSGGPVTVTHPDIERFFMTIPEAARLVVYAGGMAEGGETYILDMGEPVKIDQLARNLIHIYGFTPDVDMKIEYTGLRPGEKMFEELIMADEETSGTSNPSIMRARDAVFHEVDVQSLLYDLKGALDEDLDAVKLIKEKIPEFDQLRD